MRNVTDAVSNPFGMRPPCPHGCGETDRSAVFGYGDANADFHVIGDHPGVHGGAASGIPFTGSSTGRALRSVLDETEFVVEHDPLELRNAFLSYRHCCCVPEGAEPGSAAYDRFEPFFDAELRAIGAHVLLPVGESATAHVLETYTARAHRIELDMTALHAREIHGRGFLVVPIRDPDHWAAGDRAAIVETIESLLASGYRQAVDLGRFGPTGEPYYVR